MRKAAVALGVALGLFLVIHAVAEPFVIDLSNPATYRNDWGGPSLLGVLLVHCGPGVVAAIVSIAELKGELQGGLRRSAQRLRPCL